MPKAVGIRPSYLHYSLASSLADAELVARSLQPFTVLGKGGNSVNFTSSILSLLVWGRAGVGRGVS